MPSQSEHFAPVPGKTLLTIAIPTYNRERYIKQLLTSLESEFAAMPPAMARSIGVHVSDNHSSDGTAATLEAMKKRLPTLEVNTQPRNVGPYENIISCIEQSKGEWVWIHGDDDVTVPSGLAALVKVLQADKTDYVVLFDSRFKRPYTGEFLGQVRDYVRFCADTQPYLLLEQSLITSSVFRKDLFSSEDMRKWVATDYGHLYSLMRGCLGANARVYVPEFSVFHIPDDRPPFECWPDNIDQSWNDYLRWLGEQVGIKIDVEKAMDYTRSRLRSELRHPLRFVRKNYLNLFRPGAYPFLLKRLMTLFWKKKQGC